MAGMKVFRERGESISGNVNSARRNFHSTSTEDGNEWLSSVTTEPKSAYLVASSMISIGSTLKRSPVLTGIIICVFGIYGIVDDVKPLLAKYYKQ